MFCVGNKQFVQNKKCRGTKKCVVAVLQPRLSWDTLTLVEQILTSDQCSLWPACPSSADHNTLICVTVNIITQLINIQQQSHLNCFVTTSSPRGVECDLWKNILKENAFLCWTIICEEVSLSVFCLHCCTENTCLERVDHTAWEVKQGDWLKYKHSFLGTKRSEVSWTLLIFKHLC